MAKRRAEADGAPQSEDRARAHERTAEQRRAEERRRAKAYLDLWERHVVLSAVAGPVPIWFPAPD